ncbi:NAD-dependent epimerase/dehydratase family protein [Nocardioides perillae]|uniref:Nucleoside-diphosphate-sugar epimerase n=1 Tax=Nocardioides perillae TaxID=1119534 RepID=A0A7Y9RP80_9ACTN|nr:NAD-dependent epimerase/dehydratase family protein [Nocardioides perillae]NYG54006.1 nucleoside-diphosphate-sugar epimerase [Nocardioides perillae]
MRILVLGGTVFLSRAVAAAAVARGHDVTAACRGASGPLPDGVRHVPLDRAAARPAEVDAAIGPRSGTAYDVVVDVARRPSWVRAAVSAVPAAHWVLVSTINVYPDTATPGGTPATLALRDPLTSDEDPADGPEAYGAMKVACEQTVQALTASASVVRPGLIVGPGDPSGRFTYWPARMARVAEGEPEVLAPGDPDDRVQVVDVRDLADWLVTLAEGRTVGTFDGTGPALTREALLLEVAAGVGVEPRLTWVGQEVLEAEEVQPWSGPRSLPLWLPLPEHAGMLDHDVSASLEAGLAVRPLAETARDTLTWLRTTPDAAVTGLTATEERSVLDAWHARTR